MQTSLGQGAANAQQHRMLLVGSQLQLSVQQCLEAVALHQLLDQENHLHIRQDTGTCEAHPYLRTHPRLEMPQCEDVGLCAGSATSLQPRLDKINIMVRVLTCFNIQQGCIV